MAETRWKIAVGSESVSAAYDAAERPTGTLFVCAHGAGGNMADNGIIAVTQALRAKGIDTIRFNFLYSEKRSGRPDPMPKAMGVISAVVDRARHELSPKRLVIGGRSFGGRAASMLAADGFGVDRLLLLAYPLHPPGKPDKLRDAHLAAVKVPVLCLNGTRDDFCQRPLMEQVLARLGSNWTMRWLEGADHGFHVRKSSGRTDADVMDEIATAVAKWL